MDNCLDGPHEDRNYDNGNKHIRRGTEHHGRFPHASQISPGQKGNDSQCDEHPIGLQHREGRIDSRSSRRRTGCHRQNVSDDQCRTGDQSGDFSKVFRGNAVGATSVWIGVYRLTVGNCQYDKKEQNRCDTEDIVFICPHEQCRHKNDQHLFSCICDR